MFHAPIRTAAQRHADRSHPPCRHAIASLTTQQGDPVQRARVALLIRADAVDAQLRGVGPLCMERASVGTETDTADNSGDVVATLGACMLAMPRGLVALATDLFFGAGLESSSQDAPDEPRYAPRLSLAEQEVARHLAHAVLAAFVADQRDAITITLHDAVAPDAVSSAQVSLHVPIEGPQNARFSTTLTLPIALLPASDAARADAITVDPLKWAAALHDRVANVALTTRTVLARPELSLRQIASLRVGDILPIAPPIGVPLMVGAHRIARGTVGDRNGRAAFLVDQLQGEGQ